MAPAPLSRIGDVLVAQGALSRNVMENMLGQARGRLGDFLRSYGLVDGRDIAHAIAQQQSLSEVDLQANPPQADLFVPRDVPLYVAHRFVPYRRDANGLSIATPEPSAALQAFAQNHYRCRVTLCVTTARDLTGYFATRGSTRATRQARLALRRRYRHLTADRILTAPQMRGLIILFVALGVAAFALPTMVWPTLLVLCNAFYLATLVVKLAFYRQGVAGHRAKTMKEAEFNRAVQALTAESLPVYSILVPMYDESAEVMQRLIMHLAKLDYPKEKLDIKLICEEDDHATIAALKALRPPPTMEIIAVPPSHPRTKPKACNVALAHVRGEYVVIYDAEDAPAPDQLKRAYVMFRDGTSDLACVQASLNYYNRDENILTQLFSIEYSALFNLLLPALERMRLPIPLGGTSNHLKTSALRDVGGWDAFNVTEDADLGIRLQYFGYQTRTLPSLTLEESPIHLGGWMKQRTRWIKGYIQTWLVYTRHTGILKQRIGLKAYYGFQFFIGAPALTFLLAPIFWTTFIVSLTGLLGNPLSPTMQTVCALSFIGGVLGHWLFARKVLQMEGWEHMRLAFALYPLYWLLHSAAAARALWQLATAPHYWDKTRHGLTKIYPSAKSMILE
jgi:hypothetical protein